MILQEEAEVAEGGCRFSSVFFTRFDQVGLARARRRRGSVATGDSLPEIQLAGADGIGRRRPHARRTEVGARPRVRTPSAPGRRELPVLCGSQGTIEKPAGTPPQPFCQSVLESVFQGQPIGDNQSRRFVWIRMIRSGNLSPARQGKLRMERITRMGDRANREGSGRIGALVAG